LQKVSDIFGLAQMHGVRGLMSFNDKEETKRT